MAIEGDTPQGTAHESESKTAAEMFADMEDPEAGATEVKGDDENAEPEPQQGEEVEGDVEAEADDADADAEPEAPDNEDEPEPTPDEPKTVLIDGKPVNLEEVTKGYLRQQDYTRKTQALSVEKTEFGEAVKRVTAVDQEARHALELTRSVLAAVLPKAPDTSLLHSDPLAYIQAKESFEAAQKIIAELDTRKRQSEGRMTQEQREAEQAAMRHESDRMAELLPELKTDEGRKKFRSEAIDYGAKHYHLGEAEIDNIRSVKELMVLKDAIAYRKLMSQKMASVAKAKQAPKLAKPNARNERPATGLDSLRNLGRAPTAAELFTAMED